MIKFDVERFEAPPDPVEPEGGWKPVCTVQEHTWQLEFDGGFFELICVDAHTEEQIAEMEPNGMTPGCYLGKEYFAGIIGPFKLGAWQIERDWETGVVDGALVEIEPGTLVSTLPQAKPTQKSEPST